MSNGIVEIADGVLCNLIIHTDDEWKALDPIVEEGVLCYSYDNYVLKIGNGYSFWTDLEPVTDTSEKVPDCPNDGNQYVRVNGQWCPLVDGIVTYLLPGFFHKNN